MGVGDNIRMDLTETFFLGGSELCPMLTYGKIQGVLNIHGVIGFSFTYFLISLFV